MSSPDTDALTQELYSELKGLAATLRRQHQVRDTLNTTALVGEAYLKLRSSGRWENRQHFMRVAAHAMRQVLVDEARYWLTEKRQDGARPASLEDVLEPGHEADDEFLVILDSVLKDLAALNQRMAELVEYRYFAGYTDQEIAELMDLTPRTLRREWSKARAWIYIAVGATRSLNH